MSIPKNSVQAKEPKKSKTPVAAKQEAVSETPAAPKPEPKPFPRSLVITPEADAAIRQELLELARHPWPHSRSAAPELLAVYESEIKAVRNARRDWKHIVKIFQSYGIKIGKTSLRESSMKKASSLPAQPGGAM